MTILDNGDTLPSFTLKIGENESITLPDDLTEGYGVMLFYRGHW